MTATDITTTNIFTTIFTVLANSTATVTKPDGSTVRTLTKRANTFSPSERVRSEKGFMSFVRDGFTLTVRTNCVRLADDTACLILKLITIVADMDADRAMKRNGVGFNRNDSYLHDIIEKAGGDFTRLSTAQLLLLASKVNFYKRQLGAYEDLLAFIKADLALPPAVKAEAPEAAPTAVPADLCSECHGSGMMGAVTPGSSEVCYCQE